MTGADQSGCPRARRVEVTGLRSSLSSEAVPGPGQRPGPPEAPRSRMSSCRHPTTCAIGSERQAEDVCLLGWLDQVMVDGCPELRTDQDVVVVHRDQHHQARLRGWLDGHDGPIPIYRVELLTRLGSYGGPYTATGPDMFEALVRLRRQLEPEGLMIAVQGSRRDTYPSGMARDMGGGERI